LIDLQNSFTAAKTTKFPARIILGYHHTLSVLLHYLGKLKIRNFALFMHVKHVSNTTFYYLSNRYLSNVMKISEKINAMQNTFCSFTFYNLKALQLSKVCLSTITIMQETYALTPELLIS